MRIFRQNKLWRDKSVEMLEQQGGIVHWRRLNDEAFDQELRVKLQEEVLEVAAAKSQHELIEELADVFEVIKELCLLRGIDYSEIVAAQKNKCENKGGFSGRMFVDKTEHPEGSSGEKYCRAQPLKYPEILSE